MPTWAQERPLKKINWGQTALSAAMWIPWIAKEAKIYEKNGLDVEIVLLRGSGQSSQALLSGSLFAAPVALPQLMLADLNGADMVNVAHTIASASSKLLVRPEIKAPADLRGKRVATSSIGSLCATQARHQSRPRDYLDLDRYQCGATASVVDRRD
jgi:NitT/TauT family transport system substrate-binding protein